MDFDEMLEKYSHGSSEFPVLKEQTHKILRDGKRVSERIEINENIVHYLKDTALLISKIDGRLDGNSGFDHVIYLDKSARPVSWLVNMFWEEFAAEDDEGKAVRRPKHSYINIDRSPWFRNVGIDVSNDGRQKSNGELATYWDFAGNVQNLDSRHIAEIRAMYIEGGIDSEDVNYILKSPTILDGKKILIVDEVSRTGATLDIAKHLFKLAIPDAEFIEGAYFWHPSEPILMMGNEYVLTSLPVWYDPDTQTGRGIGSPDKHYYRNLFEHYSREYKGNSKVQMNKLRAHAFSSSVCSAPVLDRDGNVIGLEAEQQTRKLVRDLKKLYTEYKAGRIFFDPPLEWSGFKGFDEIFEKQGIQIIPEDASDDEIARIRKSPFFYPNFISKLKNNH